jgi:hypothetical protein
MPSKPKPTASNRVKPVSSAAKVRMADTKMTKAANAKAPRNPRGQQGYGMSTSKGSVMTLNSKRGTKLSSESAEGLSRKKGKDIRANLMQTAMNSNASGLKGKKLVIKRNDNNATIAGSTYGRIYSPKKKSR